MSAHVALHVYALIIACASLSTVQLFARFGEQSTREKVYGVARLVRDSGWGRAPPAPGSIRYRWAPETAAPHPAVDLVAPYPIHP